MTKTVHLPGLGDFADVPVIGILVTPGDQVEAEQPLIELESDKATMEVPAPFGGVIKTIDVAIGDKVSEGDAILTIATNEAETGTEPAEEAPAPPQSSPAPKISTEKPAKPVQDPARSTAREDANPAEHVLAGPSVRKYARELGVDLSVVRPSGPKCRMLREDVQAHVKGTAQMSQTPGGARQDTSKMGFAIDLPTWPEPDYTNGI